MKAAVYYKPGDIRIDEVKDPHLLDPTDVVVKVRYSCICGSDLWAYRGLSNRLPKTTIGHEFIGIVEEVGKKVKKLKKGDFVIAPFSRSCGVCPECKAGMTSSCRNGGYWGEEGYDSGQGEKVRVPNADHMLFAVPKKDLKEKLMPALMALSDVLPTGYHAALCAGVDKGKTVVVIGDGAVGLCAVLSSKHLGAKKIMLISTHKDRAKIGQEFGAQIINARGGKAPSNSLMRKLFNDVVKGKLNASKVFTKTINLSQIKEGYEAMDKRKAIKVLIKF